MRRNRLAPSFTRGDEVEVITSIPGISTMGDRFVVSETVANWSPLGKHLFGHPSRTYIYESEVKLAE